jgi:hypothetical protein
VRELMARGAEGVSHEVTLGKQIPVHITYFTMVAREDGEVHSFADIYGHDRRLVAALSGRPMPLEPPAASSPPPRQDRKEERRRQPYAANDVFKGLFGN